MSEPTRVAGECAVAAPFLGTVTVLVREGQRVRTGQRVAVLEAMKLEAVLTAPRDGVVARLAVRGTAPVSGGDLLLVLR